MVKLHMYIYTIYRFTKIITNSRCFENFFTGRVCESLASYLCLTISSVFPTFRVGYYAGKPTESAVYCLYEITFEQNILCFNFLWVTYAINDRFSTNLVHLKSLITQPSGRCWNKTCWLNECIQALGKNNNPLVVVSFRTIANSFPPHLQLSLFRIRLE